jgi:WD40 repeat protein/serine/threonine protein kinase
VVFENPVKPEEDKAGLAPGAMVDHFKVLRLLGRGGMGTVYLCRDTVLGRKVALKVIRPDALGNQEARKRFMLEAQLTARLAHPHIVTLFGVGEHEGTPWVALEYLDGVTLKQRLLEERPGFRESLRIALPIAEALEAAHERGVLHRDLKPNNVLLARDGRPRVLDFGLAKLVSTEREASSDLARTGEIERDAQDELEDSRDTYVHGTPRYMSPEQWMGDPSTPATDMWAFGFILYELFIGTHPFATKPVRTICLAVTRDRPVPNVLDNAEGLPPELVTLIDRCLRKAADKRPTATEVIAILSSMLLGDPDETLITRTPFRGLLPFAERHANHFFARGAEINAYCERLRDEPMLPVVGSSGAGKSSFVQAGVIPRLREQGSWLVLRIRPGSRPFETLAVRLLQGRTGMDGSGSTGTTRTVSFPPQPKQIRDEERNLAAELEKHPTRLSLHLEALSEKHAARVLLFVDQLEELYTLCPEGAEETRGRFMEALCAAADNREGPVRVVMTARDDFLSRLAEGPGARLAFDRVMVLRTPGPEALVRMLEKSIMTVAYRFDDPDLPKEMVQAVAGVPSALPLLQFAGQTLWERRDRKKKVVTREAYEAMGGVEGALVHHLDNVLAGLSVEQEKIAREVFLRLITPQSTRRVLTQSELVDGLGPDAEIVIERLTRERAIVPRRGQEEPELELVHESLIRTWDRLVRWLEESRDERLFLAEVGQAASLWEQRNKPKEEVWRGSALTEALLKAKRVHRLPALVNQFLDAGVQRERRLTKRRQRIWASGIIISLLAAIAAVAVSVVVSQKEREASRQRAQAEAQRAEADREGARAAFARGDMMEARAKLRSSLETRDSYFARALWWRLNRLPLQWTKRLGAVVYATAFSPDGKTVAATCMNGSVYLFDAKTSAVQVLRGHTDQVTSAAYAPDGKSLATGSWGGAIRIWNLHDGSARELSAGDAGVWALAYSPDGRWLASSGGDDNTIVLWDVKTGKRRLLHGHEADIYGLAFSPDGATLGSASRDKTVRLWEVESGKLKTTLEGHQDVAWHLQFAPQGDLLASASADNTIILWDVRTQKVHSVLRGHQDEVRGVSFSPDGKTLASGSNDRTIRLWDVGSGKERAVLRRHQDDVRNVAFSPDGRLLSSASYDKTVRLWKLEGAELETEPGGHEAVTWVVSVSPDGKLVASGSRDKTVRLWDVKSGRQVSLLLGHEANVCGLAFSPDGKTLASGSYDKTVRLWNVETGAQTAVLRGHEAGVMGVAFDPTGQRVISGSRDKTVRTWSTADGRELSVLHGHASAVWTVAYGPEGKLLASGGQDKTVRIWDAQSGRQEAVLIGHHDAVMGVSFTPDGAGLASGSTDKSVRLWDLVSKESRTIGHYEGRVYGLEVHPDGKLIGVPTSDGFAKLWSIDSDNATVLRGHRSEVNCLRFSRDGKIVATSSDDWTVRLWDTATGQPAWRAPLLRNNTELLTHEGWMRLDGEPFEPPANKWRQAVEREGRLASESTDGSLMCLATHKDALELWDLNRDQRIATEQLERIEQIVALPDGCAALTTPTGKPPSVVLLKTSGGATQIASESPTAIDWGKERLLVASAGKVFAHDSSGALVDTYEADVGVTAIRQVGDWIAVGFRDGNIELVSTKSGVAPSGFTFEDVPSSPVVSVREGPTGTLIAGFANGLFGLWSMENGKQFDHARMHGPVVHLLFRYDRLYAASELGQHRVLDLRVFGVDYCELLEDVWAEVPVVWQGGLPVPRPPPKDPICEQGLNQSR